MSKFSNRLSDAELERLAILAEELGEAQQAVGKILRHGYWSRSPFDAGGRDNREDLEKELGDVLCVLMMMSGAKDISRGLIESWAEEKAEKMKPYLHHQGIR